MKILNMVGWVVLGVVLAGCPEQPAGQTTIIYQTAETATGSSEDGGGLTDAASGPDVKTCQDVCDLLGARQCQGNAVQTCKDYDGDGCLEWGGDADCVGGTVCQGGFCSVGCEAECTVKGVRKCEGDGYVVCGDANFDGCLEWSDPVPCTDGLACSNGYCGSECSDECTVLGARQCGGSSAVETCGDHDQDGCLEWGDSQDCPAGEVCSNGFCASDCSDECSVIGATRCSANSVQSCGHANGDSCLEWGTPVPCDAGLSCSNGHCGLGCTDECTVKGATACDGAGYKTCDDANADGCLEWGTVVTCAAGQTCSSGKCSSTCTDECTVVGSKKCLGVAVQTCGNVDADPCLEWGTAQPCGSGETCSGGFCASGCTDECSVNGASACEGAGVKVCGDANQDGCLEWGTVVPCVGTQTCSGGKCSTTCTDECTVVGAKQCDGTGVQTCGNVDSDPCLEWGTAVACAAGQTCSGGFCTSQCTDECTVKGAKQCSGDGYRVCDNSDADPCLEWGTAVACGAGQTCSNGNCSSSCTDECTILGAKQCGAGGVQTCGNTDADGCLEWGTAEPCAAGQVCVAGNCALTCTDACSVKGARQCANATDVQVCDDWNQDGCLEWGTAVPCENGGQCSSGNCALDCANECDVVGSKRCNVAATGAQTCDDWDQDGCLEWSSDVPCTGGSVCSNGQCAAQCSDECPSAGAKRCTPGAAAVETCGDYNQDGCLQWGTPLACTAQQACQDGACSDLAAPGAVVINELFYDAVGSDSTSFIELAGEPGLELAGFELVGINGSNGQEYHAIPLTGALGADGLFVVSMVAGPETDMVTPNADMQNGPDSVELRWAGKVVDALGYGTFTAGTTFAGEGTAAPGVAAGHSLGRNKQHTDTNDNIVDFHDFAGPTPGAPNGGDNVSPVAVLACPGSGAAAKSLIFDGGGSSDADGQIVDYRFDFGDGAVLSGPASSVAHTFAQAGSVTVTLTVTDDAGGTGTATCTLVLSDPNAPTVVWVAPFADLTVTQGDTTLITVDVTPGPGKSITSAQLLADGQPVGVPDEQVPYQFTFTVPAQAPTGVPIALQVAATDNTGATGTSSVRTLHVVNDPPLASFSAIISGNLRVTVDASGSSDTETASAALEVRWDWENDGTWDTAWSTTKVVMHEYAADGAHTMAMEVRDAVGQTATTTRTVDFQSVQDISGAVQTTTWFGTINITGDTWVEAGQTLTIASGTTVVFVETDQNMDGVGDFELTIDGTLVVEGAADAPVTFTALDTDGKNDASAWVGLILNGGGHVIDHAVVEYADIGIDVRSNTTLRNLEVRQNRLGVRVSSGALTFEDSHLHHQETQGLQVEGGKVTATGLVVSQNGGHGILLTGGTGHAFTDTTIRDNVKTGVFFRGGAGGLVTRSNILDNGGEGVRAMVYGSNPAPTLTLNNITGNATTETLTVATVNLSAAVSSAGSGTQTSSTWSAPGGGEILLMYVDYAESGGSSSDPYVASDCLPGGQVVFSLASTTSAAWRPVTSKASTVACRVVDGTSGAGGTCNIYRVAYEGAGTGRQVTTLLTGGQVMARKNYLGAWPDVLSAVTFESPGTLDIQGFVGVPFDAAFDTGIYYGGETLSGDVTWNQDVYVTGDVAIATGGSLTVAEGVTVTFVAVDQDGDHAGDFDLDRAAGTLTVLGAPAAPVTFTSLGAPLAGGDYEWLEGSGNGTTQMDWAIIEKAQCGLVSGAGSTTLQDVTVQDTRDCGIRLAGTAALTMTRGTLQRAATHGLTAKTSGAISLDGVHVTDNAGWGLRFDSCHHVSNHATNLLVEKNTDGGVLLRHSDVALDHSHLKFNGFGLWTEGMSKGAVTANDILFNTREGVVASRFGGNHPSTVVNGNNIFGNATAQALDQAAVSISASVSSAASGTDTSPYWATPSGLPILTFLASYSETGGSSSYPYVSGSVQGSGGTAIVGFTNTTSANWYDAWDRQTHQLRAEVVDGTSGAGGTTSVTKVIFLGPTTEDPPRLVEMTVQFSSGTFDAKGNYWGVFPDVASRVQEFTVGTADYTGFKSTQVSGTGPQP